jgi:hypothetical protein
MKLSSSLLPCLTRLNFLSKPILPFASSIVALRPKSLTSTTLTTFSDIMGCVHPASSEFKKFVSTSVTFSVVMLVVYHLYQQRPCTVTQASMPSLRRRSLMRSLGCGDLLTRIFFTSPLSKDIQKVPADTLQLRYGHAA